MRNFGHVAVGINTVNRPMCQLALFVTHVLGIGEVNIASAIKTKIIRSIEFLSLILVYNASSRYKSLIDLQSEISEVGEDREK